MSGGGGEGKNGKKEGEKWLPVVHFQEKQRNCCRKGNVVSGEYCTCEGF